MNGLSVTCDNREALADIERKIGVLNNPYPLLKKIMLYSMAMTRKMFFGPRPDNSSVRGEFWPKLAESTIKAKRAMAKRKGTETDRPLVLSGEMRNSLMNESAIKIQGKGATYGTEVLSENGFPFPGVHQEGAPPVPQRRFLFWTNEDMKNILTMCVDFVDQKLRSIRG